jgi:rSAM/selenodomain-associated transferase 1
VLVVAKAPVAGLAKTRLAATVGSEAAAELAAAALLDTLDAVRSLHATAHVVALTGDLACAHRTKELVEMLADFVVLPQRGDGLDERLAAAHADAATVAVGPVLQIGMDTPQVSSGLLAASAESLAREDVGGVFGPATDGGWWALGLSDPGSAKLLLGIPMSQPDTGERTLAALKRAVGTVVELPELTDVDTAGDLRPVAALQPAGSRFRLAVELLGPLR